MGHDFSLRRSNLLLPRKLPNSGYAGKSFF